MGEKIDGKFLKNYRDFIREIDKRKVKDKVQISGDELSVYDLLAALRNKFGSYNDVFFKDYESRIKRLNRRNGFTSITYNKNRRIIGNIGFYVEENGYYYCIDFEEKYNKVFRFYKASNKVIGATIGSTLSEIRFTNLFPSGNWFNEYYKDNARYEITTSGNKIAFKVGNVHYKGTLLEGQKIELFSHSDINGHEDTKVFKFISLDVLEDIKKLDKNDK